MRRLGTWILNRPFVQQALRDAFELGVATGRGATIELAIGSPSAFVRALQTARALLERTLARAA